MKIKNCGKNKGTDKIQLYNCDNMKLMKQIPDNYFHLAIVDPPYGINVTKMNMGGRKTIKKDSRTWDNAVPTKEYWKELKRVSAEQIVWGGNYFKKLWPTRCFIVWDKGNAMRGRSFADCELAWTSFDASARIYDRTATDKNRIHHTQKPIKLYAWTLEQFAEPSWRILDTHLGSGSSAIAAYFFGCEFIGCEIDKKYFKKAIKRFKKETEKATLFGGIL